MRSRREGEENERIIRGVLKLPENRRCINCNSLGPQYVCTNFWTFVCTNCSGIHREFAHRVKSVSMAKFTSQEVRALQEGGNQRAKEVYLKELDPQRISFPDSSNVERLRDFIKHVYVDRRYTGESNLDKPPSPRTKMGQKEDSYENRRQDSYQGGSRSPDTYERRYSDRSSPVRYILGDNTIPLRISEPPKANSGATDSNSSVHTQATLVEWSFLLVALCMEMFSIACDQASSPSKPRYALAGMLLAYAGLLTCISELIYKGRKEKLEWRRWWFYYPLPAYKPFGTLPEIYGLLGGISQCICSTVQYVFFIRHAENPIKVSLWPALLLICLGAARLTKNRHGDR